MPLFQGVIGARKHGKEETVTKRGFQGGSPSRNSYVAFKRVYFSVGWSANVVKINPPFRPFSQVHAKHHELMALH